jgi:4-amino-4-deoxy-L-arabinose transferase-like glycosyltransferase
LLSIDISAPWRLVHEDNGAMQSTLALSHLRYGVGQTRAHNLFIDRRTGARQSYTNHPPGVPLVLAAAFDLTGEESPAIARGVMIALSLGTLVLMFWILSFLFDDENLALTGCFIMATLPMQSFFGRMVNYEAPTLFFACLQLAAYLQYGRTRRRSALVLLGGSIVAGGLFDWPSFFFSSAITVSALIDWRRGGLSKGSADAFLTTALATSFGVLFDLAHIVFASGSIEQFLTVLKADTGEGHPALTVASVLLRQTENFRNYFTHSGLIAAMVTAAALVLWRSPLAAALFRPADEALARFLAITGSAATAYLVSSPVRAQIHHYWQFYFLPFTVVSLAVVIRWMRDARARGHRSAAIALQLMLLEIVLSSGYKLYRRHTRPDDWAIRASRQVEENYLIPK